MDYLEVTLKIEPRDPWTEIVMMEMGDAGYESFVETEEGIIAYAQLTAVSEENPFKDTLLENGTEEFTYSYEAKIIEQQNWNALWEADFHPVVVEEYLTILAPFHEKEGKTGMLVEILPKMSFGTGHHQTTWMMAKAMFELEKMPEHVLDMGTGTGVLAIIAEKLGAKNILAVDIEDWSVENTLENAERNACSHIEALCGDIDVIGDRSFGLILANINKNVLKAHMSNYSKMLSKEGILLLSGFFDSDVDELVTLAESYGLTKVKVFNKDNWAAIKLLKHH